MERKYKKVEVNYTPKAKYHSERCELCKYFLPKTNECRLVGGVIKPEAWCKEFERK